MSIEIKDWLNSQHEWLQEAALRLLKQGSLTSVDITDLVNLIKTPSKPGSAARIYPTIGSSAPSSGLRLVSIGPIVGIDALGPRKPLEFGKGSLTAVYGKNGSGKSGYTRIISKVCGKSHSVDLKANVYKPTPAVRQCTVTYEADGTEKTCDWTANSEPVADLQSVDVFDTDNGRLYLERENEVSYAPPVLALFADLVDTCKRVDGQLSGEQGKLVSALPKLPAEYANSSVATRYSALAADIDPKILHDLVTWNISKVTELKSQQDRLKEQDPTAAARKRREVKTQIDALIASVNKGVKALGLDALTALKKLSGDAVAARKAATEGAKALGSLSSLEGIGSETWRAMWQAARDYSVSEAYPEKDYPFTGDDSRCVLCQQELDADAKRRLLGFEGFVKGKLESDANAAETQLKEGLNWLPSRPAKETLATSCQAADIPEATRINLEAAWELLEEKLIHLRAGIFTEEPPVMGEIVTQTLKSLSDLSVSAETAATELEADAQSADRTEATKKLLELEASKWVTQQATGIQDEINRLKQTAQYAEWRRKTTTNAITLQSGRMSQELVTDAYIARFNEELKKLGAGGIQVELVKTGASYGKNKHRVRLKGLAAEGAKIADVLSEGERRIVALAAFLADVTGRDGSSPFVFDDPISSLDQDFEEMVIARLVELSQSRQVLIFTHRLSFLGIMTDMAGANLNDIHIRREFWGTGEPGGVPVFGKKPESALTNLKNDRLARAAKILRDEGSELYYPLAKAICSDFRALLERIVENHLLAGVIQRHSREVHTKVMWDLLKVEAQDCQLIDDMMTKYSKFEHSQPIETPVEVPVPAELEADIDRMLQWCETFKKRKVPA